MVQTAITSRCRHNDATGMIVGLIGKQAATTYPSYQWWYFPLTSIDSSGLANRAFWEFYRGPGLRAIGQYDLEIIFRIPEYSRIKDKRQSYCIDWNVEVNGRRLIDHRPELYNEYWNVKSYDGRPVMLHGEGSSDKKPKNILKEKKEKDKGVKLF